jgi:hypothetical protein
MRILIKFPTRGRRKKFFETLDSYYNLSEDVDNLKFLITIDEDDLQMNNSETIENLKKYKNVEIDLGMSKSKVDAINKNINVEDSWDILLLASDDMVPQIKGYDTIISKMMEELYPDTDGVLFFNDGFKGNELNTLCILGKKYYKRFNYIYNPEYKSTWCDNEFMEVANILKKQTYLPITIIKHEHPDWGFGKNDDIHSKNYQNLNWDKDTYTKRKNMKFNL